MISLLLGAKTWKYFPLKVITLMVGIAIMSLAIKYVFKLF